MHDPGLLEILYSGGEGGIRSPPPYDAKKRNLPEEPYQPSEYRPGYLN